MPIRSAAIAALVCLATGATAQDKPQLVFVVNVASEF